MATILDRIKWEIEAPLTPIQGCTRATTKTRHFSHHWNGGRGGLNFSSILSKIAILDRVKWEIEAPLPPIQWCTRATTKTRHFFHHWNGGRGGLNFSSILSKIVAPWACKMNQIARCDWLHEQVRWSHLAHSGLPALSREKNFPESQMINPLLTRLFWSRWLDIGLVFFFLRVYACRPACRPACRWCGPSTVSAILVWAQRVWSENDNSRWRTRNNLNRECYEWIR